MWKVLFVVYLLLAVAASLGLRECKGKEIRKDAVGMIYSHNGRARGWIHYANNLNCTWVIEGHSNEKVHLHVFEFSFQRSDNCARDSLTIYDGPDVTSPVMRKVCGKDHSLFLYSSGSSLTLRFITDGSITDMGFQANYQLQGKRSGACKKSEKKRDEAGIMTSQGEEMKRQKNQNCTWIIVGRPNKIIRLSGTTFSPQRSDNCARVNLTVYDGPVGTSPVIRRSCGEDIKQDMFSTGQHLTVRFVTKGTGSVIIFYRVVDRGSRECKGEEIRDEEGYITSHIGFASAWNNYANNLRCTWTIHGRPNKIVVLKFPFFSLQSSDNCTRDRLTVHDDSNEVWKLCGEKRPDEIFSSGQILTLRFTTDGSVTSKGFVVYYRLVDRKASQCFGRTILNETEGLILSHPGIFAQSSKDLEPYNYSNNLNCKWFIIGRPGKVIHLRIDKIDLQLSDNCARDSLTVYDGTDVISPVIRKLCGNEPDSIWSTGQGLTLKFTTDGSVTGRGFTVDYKVSSRWECSSPLYRTLMIVSVIFSLLLFLVTVFVSRRLYRRSTIRTSSPRHPPCGGGRCNDVIACCCCLPMRNEDTIPIRMSDAQKKEQDSNVDDSL